MFSNSSESSEDINNYMICFCGDTFSTEEELKLHLEIDHAYGETLESESTQFTSEKEKNEKSAGDDKHEIAVNDELEEVIFTDKNNHPLLTVKVKKGAIESITQILSIMKAAKRKQQKIKQKIRKTKRMKDITHETLARAMGNNYKPQVHIIPHRKVVDETLISVTKMSFDDAIEEVQRRQEAKDYKAAKYHCQICYCHFYSQDTYDKHMLHHSELHFPFECKICKYRKRSIKELRYHVVNQHLKKYSCTACPFTTTYKTSAHKHEDFHKGSKYTCLHCDKQFTSKSTCDTHVRVKHPARYPCALCGFTFVSKFGVMVHQNRTHEFDDQVALAGPCCALCAVQFRSQEAHDRHLRLCSLHVSDNLMPNTILSLKRSSDTQKQKRSRKQAQADKELKRRRRRRPGDPPLPAVVRCELCGVTTLRYNIKRHMLLHTSNGVKPFQCDICEKKFMTKAETQSHVNHVHLKIPRPPRAPRRRDGPRAARRPARDGPRARGPGKSSEVTGHVETVYDETTDQVEIGAYELAGHLETGAYDMVDHVETVAYETTICDIDIGVYQMTEYVGTVSTR